MEQIKKFEIKLKKHLLKISVITDFIRKELTKEILFFITITLGFHYFFRYWDSGLGYWPFEIYMNKIYRFLSKYVFEQSAWFISSLLDGKVTLSEQQFNFINNSFISIGAGCSGLKQMMQFVVVFLFVRGPAIKKLWIIPLGVLAMHLTNLFRVICLSFIILKWPGYWHFSHDYLFRPIFYIIIWAFWILWIEKIKPIKS